MIILIMFCEVHLFKNLAIVPSKGSANSAGYDIYSCSRVVIPSKSRAIVPTGVGIRMPNGVYGRIAPRSGLASKKCIDIGGGVIDPDYRGEIHVIMVNDGDDDYIVNYGDRIAQLIFEKYLNIGLSPIGFSECTERDDRGFGSTGF